MNKLQLIIIFLFLISNTYSLKEAKSFLKEFIKTTGKEKAIENFSEQCLGKFFDYHYILLKKNYKENNFEKLSKNLENIAIDIFINCPNYELISIFNKTDFEKISSLPTTQIMSKIFFLVTKIYSKYINDTLDGESLGRIFGDIINMFRDNITETNELQTEKKSVVDDVNQYFDILEGIFIGMKEKDDGSESKCYKDVLKGKTKILSHIEDGIKKVDKEKTISEIISSTIFSLISVEGLVADCNLLIFGARIISKIASIKDMNNLFDSNKANYKLYIGYLDTIADSLKDNNLKNLGKNIGKILSDILDFHVK